MDGDDRRGKRFLDIIYQWTKFVFKIKLVTFYFLSAPFDFPLYGFCSAVLSNEAELHVKAAITFVSVHHSDGIMIGTENTLKEKNRWFSLNYGLF